MPFFVVVSEDEISDILITRSDAERSQKLIGGTIRSFISLREANSFRDAENMRRQRNVSAEHSVANVGRKLSITLSVNDRKWILRISDEDSDQPESEIISLEKYASTFLCVMAAIDYCVANVRESFIIYLDGFFGENIFVKANSKLRENGMASLRLIAE